MNAKKVGLVGALVAFLASPVGAQTLTVEKARAIVTPEVIAGLMIALNFGARFFAILLIFFVAATIYYFPPENPKTLMDALKSLSIIGALFIIVGYGRAPRKV